MESGWEISRPRRALKKFAFPVEGDAVTGMFCFSKGCAHSSTNSSRSYLNLHVFESCPLEIVHRRARGDEWEIFYGQRQFAFDDVTRRRSQSEAHNRAVFCPPAETAISGEFGGIQRRLEEITKSPQLGPLASLDRFSSVNAETKAIVVSADGQCTASKFLWFRITTGR